MNRCRIVRLSLFASAAFCASSAAQTTERVSVSSGGAQANDNSGDNSVADGLSISLDGRYVAFESYASDLVGTDTNGFVDVFVRDRQSGTTERVSVDSAGVEANGDSRFPSISADGRCVAFASFASNLVGGDTNASYDVLVRDRQSATTERVSVDIIGVQGNDASFSPSISPDGRYVVFLSWANNLVTGDTNWSLDVFVRDRQSATTERVSVDSTGGQGDGSSYFPSISANGRYVSFHGYATNLVPGDTNGFADVFVHDRQSGMTECVSVDSAGVSGNGDSAYVRISADGRYAAFWSRATNLVAGDTNGLIDVFVRDRQSGLTARVSVDSSGMQANGDTVFPSISADGRFVAFSSLATNLVTGDTNGQRDVFLRDRHAATTERVSVDSVGTQCNGISYAPSMSAYGVAFVSSATNLVTGDTNNAKDVFVRDRGCAVCAYCTAGTTSHGCVATISGVGAPSASLGSGFTLSVSALEGQKPGILFYGIDNSGFAPLAWGASSSWLCVKSPTQRMGAQSSGGNLNACDGALTIDWNAFIATHPGALGQPFVSGQHVFAQAWFRDPPSPKMTNLSDALEFVVLP